MSLPLVPQLAATSKGGRLVLRFRYQFRRVKRSVEWRGRLKAAEQLPAA